jgi:hydroxyethylthiazole kinase-like uncharacterized protein yjeF
LIPVVTASEMRAIDEETIRDYVPGLKLMESAGRGVADEIIRTLKPRKRSKIIIICGKGNNGGDGFVVARRLKRKGYRPKTYLIGKAADVKGDAAVNLKRCSKGRIRVEELAKLDKPFVEDVSGADIIVDALFGTGFSGRPRGLAADVIEVVNAAGGIKVAVDIPSGVDATTGKAALAVGANLTVTMALPKTGHMFFPGRALSGELVVHDIGVSAEVIMRANLQTFVLGKTDIQQALPERPPDAHKWSCGHVVAICGSTGYTGAAYLTSISALRAGCGLVTLVIPRSLNPIMEVKLTEVMTLPVEETARGSLSPKARSEIEEMLECADAVALGPGLSRHRETVKLVRSILPRLKVPCVLDADGINAFAGRAHSLKGLTFPLIITPHAGEAARVFGVNKDRILARRVDFAREVAGDLGLVMVLKGAPSVVAGPDGDAYINATGNQGLATAGSGDVLTGMIAGFLAQGVPALEAASSGVYMHGLLGDMLLEEHGYFGFTAGDLADKIPEAMASMVFSET